MAFFQNLPYHLADSKRVQRVYCRYRDLFSIAEIETSVTLQWLFGALLLFFYITFYQWVHSSSLSAASANSYLCWPYLESCKSFLFFSNLPHAYTQTLFYTLVLGVLITIVYCMWKKQWSLAHALLLILWVWKMCAGFVLDYGILGMYDYYHLILTAVVLFLPFKEFFAKAAFVLLYFLSGALKIYPAWTLGTYFTSLQLGLPLIPNALVPLATSIVIFSQIVGSWFLMGRNAVLQKTAFVFFTFFHFYSTILVGYNYPSIALPVEIILFGPLYRYQSPPLSRRAIAGWIFCIALFAFQLPAYLIGGDQKITLEGYRFGVWMYDSNHQCALTISAHYATDAADFAPKNFKAMPGTPCGSSTCLTAERIFKDEKGWTRTLRYESPNAWSRCSPYPLFKRSQSLCGRAETVSLQLDHSINGGPFYRIVDEIDICDLRYKPWSHNEWIKEPPDAPAVGYPVMNTYSGWVL